MKNKIYPCGEEFESFNEYRVNCPVCGEIISFFLPSDKINRSYRFNNDTCHLFVKTFDQGFRDFYPHKMIKLREDMMGGGHSADFYNLYPVINGETVEARKERLAQIKIDELSDLLKDNPAKKDWIIRTLINKNENILNALDTVLRKYEATACDKWGELDSLIENINEKDSAVNLLARFGVNTRYSSAVINNNQAVNMSHIGYVFADVETVPAVSSDLKAAYVNNSWFCPACGTKSEGNFCPECGTKNPQ